MAIKEQLPPTSVMTNLHQLTMVIINYVQYFLVSFNTVSAVAAVAAQLVKQISD
jgi:hypothetical protein